MKRTICLALIMFLAGIGSVALADDDTGTDNTAAKRDRLNSIAAETVAELRESQAADQLFNEAYGYAAFSSMKFAFGASGGGGSGVAVNGSTGDRTYMKMGTVGVGFGLGGKKYRIVFLFENEKVFTKFVEKGWQADASANATAGTDGVAAATTFHNGLAVYQFSKKGLMAHAEVAGTKYWQAGKLN